MRRKIIAVIGDACIEKDSIKYRTAFETGKLLIDNGFRIQCGGYGGVMEATCKGARSSEKYKDGDIIGIIPSFNADDANEYIDIAIPTGLDIYRNVIVANASGVIMIGGGSGTLCEACNAWALSRLIIAYDCVEGWSSKVSGIRLDNRKRYPEIPDDKIYSASNADEMIKVLLQKLPLYNMFHKGIAPGK